MNGFVVFSASIFLYFSFHILDQGACASTVALSIDCDPSKNLTFVHFKDQFLPFASCSTVHTNFGAN